MSCELNKLIGTALSIRGTKHLVVGIGTERILLLQYNEKDEPIQYVVGIHPYFAHGTLVWEHGCYFPFFCYRDDDRPDYHPMAEALRDASSILAGDCLYACFQDDEDYGIHCVGIFTQKSAAVALLEHNIRKDRAAQEYASELGKEHLSLSDYEEIAGRDELDNQYWIETICLNKASC